MTLSEMQARARVLLGKLLVHHMGKEFKEADETIDEIVSLIASTREQVLDEVAAGMEKTRLLEVGVSIEFKPSHPHSSIGWRERFDEKFSIYEGEGITRSVMKHPFHETIKSFIAQEIQMAEERGRNEAVDYIEKKLEEGLRNPSLTNLDKIMEAARASSKEVL